MKWEILMINKYSYIAILALGAISCSTHFTDRCKEHLVVESGSFNKLKATNIVREAIDYPTDEFSLTLESNLPLETPNGSFPLHLLKADFIPTGERMIFAIIDPIKDEIKTEFEFELLESGQVRVFGKNGIYLADEIPFVAADGLLAAKPIEYAVVSKRKKTSAIASFIPLPVQKSVGKKSLSLEVSHPMLTRFMLTGVGFEPNETVTLCHTSGANQEILELVADESGELTTELLPYVIGKLGGEAQIAVDDLTLDYSWGTRLEKVTFEEKALFPVLFVVNRQDVEIDGMKIQKAFASYSFIKG